MGSGETYVSMGSDGSREEQIVTFNSLEKLKAVCKLLRDHGDRIMRGETSVTLTGQMLYEMNEALDNFQDGLSPPHLSMAVQDRQQERVRTAELEAWNFRLRLLQDVVTRAPMLIVYSGGKQDKLDYRCGFFPVPTCPPVRLCYFASLQHLQISFIPIGLIQDMLKLRPKLESLTLTNCLPPGSKLQDVLEVCDHDISVPMQWVALKRLCLKCNGLRELDGSLRLCPVLETIDLSMNRLATTDEYLGYLMELRHIDLSYNCLVSLPTVAVTTKKKLHTLILAGNRITDISGIDDLDSLVVLDLSENHICSHSKLVPLRQLHRLEKLSLEGCPISVKKQHRVISLHHISSLALSRKFTLDGRPATVSEIRNSRLSIYREVPPQYSAANAANTFMIQSRPSDRVGDGANLVAPGDQPDRSFDSDLATSVQVITAGKKKSRRKAKQRTLEIADMDTSTGGEISSREESPASSYRVPSRLEGAMEARRKQVQKTREEIEELRRHYGENWLQAISDQEKLPRPMSSDTTHTTVSSKISVQTDVHVKDADGNGALHIDDVSDLENSSHHLEGGGTKLKRVVNWNGTKSKKDHPHQQVVQADVEVKVFSRETMLPESSPEMDEADNDVLSPEQLMAAAVPVKCVVRLKEDEELDSGVPLSDSDGGVTNRGFVPDDASKDKANRTAEESFQYSSRQKKQDDPSMTTSETSTGCDTSPEPEDQSEPFIVTLPDKGDDPLIVTVSPRFLVEKDINGKIKELLDLQSLEGARLEIEKMDGARSDDGSEDMDNHAAQVVKVRMDFSYIRKDRRLRVYVMEDFATAQHFMELVQPFLKAKAEAVLKKLLTEYQCLKCNAKFTRGEAHTSVQLEDIPRIGSIRDFNLVGDMAGEKVTLMCPKCKSDHIVLLESGEENQSSADFTPVGSLTSTSPRSASLRRQSLDQLMASHPPMAHSTPFKQHTSSSDTQFSRSVEIERGIPGTPKKGNAQRSLFTHDDKEMVGDGLNAARGGRVPSQKEDIMEKGRERSNAFYGELPTSHECSSSVDPVTEPSGLNAQHASSLNPFSPTAPSSQQSGGHSGTEWVSGKKTVLTAATSNSLSAVPVRDALLKSGVVSSNTALMAGSSRSSELGGGGGLDRLGSVDSDITILPHHDSAVSLGAASSKSSDTETITTETFTHAIPATKLTPASKYLALSEDVNSETKSLDSKPGEAKGEKHSLESTEVTPLGSPLSSSVCSSMVSSIYYNSLQPNTSCSTAYVTASDDSSLMGNGEEDGGQEEEEEEEAEMSIYDTTVTRIRTRSPHKESISSEVEVLMVEQAVKETLAVGDTSSERHSDDHSDAVDGSEGIDGMPGAKGGGEMRGGESFDFERLDHRLALHLNLSVFDNDEEFCFKTKTMVCQYMMEEEYSALVVVTTMKIYILRITSDDPDVEPKDAMTVVEIQPLPELDRAEVGLGGQTLRLEFKTDCSSYTFIMFSEEKVQAFVERLRDHLKKYAKDTNILMTTKFSEEVDKQTMDNLESDVLHCEGQPDALRLYTLGYIARGHNLHYPIAFVVSVSEVCLVRTNHQWPSPHLQAPVTVETVGRQFVVLERQKINNIATVARHSTNKLMMKITFFNETSGEETHWLITMETEKSIMGMIDALKEPWEEVFGVQMDIETEEYELCL